MDGMRKMIGVGAVGNCVLGSFPRDAGVHTVLRRAKIFPSLDSARVIWRLEDPALRDHLVPEPLRPTAISMAS